MPPLDLDTVVVSRDGDCADELKAACGGDTALPEPDDDVSDNEEDPYAPAQSLRLRIGEDIDWSDVVVGAAAAVLERRDSTKGAGANPKCAARRSMASAARGSQLPPTAPAPRAAVAVVIGGLPGKAAAREHGRQRRSPCRLGIGGRARVFAAAGEVSESDRLVVAEPGSPKVSCLGGVRSQPRAAVAEGVGGSGRRWWGWLVVADAMSCCWKSGTAGER
ncbi:hypothetical protein HU200_038699 [Digitaria exilis]|uniref:Uncharacterized protein n=1 Tax=Digitaria exilis TaxID=1010633 RepID=A0A835BB31_9POAL|nr:hypothetical protein HU200_038699 [Digitaria exilis]